MMVCGDRWYNGVNAFVLFAGGRFFYFIGECSYEIKLFSRKDASYSRILLKKSVFKLLKEGIQLYDKVSTDLNFVEREKKTEKFWRCV